MYLLHGQITEPGKGRIIATANTVSDAFRELRMLNGTVGHMTFRLLSTGTAVWAYYRKIKPSEVYRGFHPGIILFS
jgi:hypothetical protein